MRVIQTSDIHLDRTFAALELPPAQGTACRRYLFETLQAILNRAAAWPAHALVICGDIFEHDRITRATLKELREAFAGIAPVQVFLCPGQSDACQSGSAYLTEQWPDNVYCFRKPVWESVPIDGIPLTIHGYGWDRPDYHGGLPADLALPEDGRVHMAFGHGLATRVLPGTGEGAARFESDVALPHGLAYMGLGGLHAGQPIEGDFSMPVWYAGAPASQAFDERGPHHYLEIEVGQPGDALHIRPQVASEPRFGAISVDCSTIDTGQGLIDAVRDAVAARAGIQFLRLTLEGSIPRQLYNEMDGIRDALSDCVQYLQWRDTCQLAEDFDAIAREHTSLGAFMDRIGGEIDDAPNPGVRRQRMRSRDLALCAHRSTELPVQGMTGDYR